jgi:hypothetical protein
MAKSVVYTSHEVLTFMQGETRERWWLLCEQAAVEQDPEKLLELTKEINRLLEEKERNLQKQRRSSKSANSD